MGDLEVWFVYLVQCSDGSLYCGITKDIPRRLKEHNGLLPGGARYTRSRRPVELIASVSVGQRSEAAKLECRVKRLPREKKPLFLRSVGPRPCDSVG
ncbi:GIY-YIG nuclease family protein [Fundidesulfovibrio butyratiphilus]